MAPHVLFAQRQNHNKIKRDSVADGSTAMGHRTFEVMGAISKKGVLVLPDYKIIVQHLKQMNTAITLVKESFMIQ
jgi:hypothetical protein